MLEEITRQRLFASWASGMVACRKGVGAMQEGVILLPIPGRRLDAISPTLSRHIFLDEDFHALRLRSQLDQSIKNALVLDGTRSIHPEQRMKSK